MVEQTVGHMTSKHAKLRVSTDGVNYTDISGSSNSFSPTGGSHGVGSTHTFEGTTPVVGLGRKELVTATIRMIYTEVDGESADLFDGFFNNQDPIWVDWRPAGDGVGKWQWIGKGYCPDPVTPAGDATSSDIIVKEVTWVGCALTMGPQAS